jgi:hypothetical protein
MTAKRAASVSACDLMGEFCLVAFMAGKYCPGDYVYVQLAASLLPKRLFGEKQDFDSQG